MVDILFFVRPRLTDWGRILASMLCVKLAPSSFDRPTEPVPIALGCLDIGFVVQILVAMGNFALPGNAIRFTTAIFVSDR